MLFAALCIQATISVGFSDAIAAGTITAKPKESPVSNKIEKVAAIEIIYAAFCDAEDTYERERNDRTEAEKKLAPKDSKLPQAPEIHIDWNPNSPRGFLKHMLRLAVSSRAYSNSAEAAKEAEELNRIRANFAKRIWTEVEKKKHKKAEVARILRTLDLYRGSGSNILSKGRSSCELTSEEQMMLIVEFVHD